MNARKSKMLRKLAEQKNIGNSTDYQFYEKSIYYVAGKSKPYCHTLELKDCTRKAYRQLKRGINNERNSNTRLEQSKRIR